MKMTTAESFATLEGEAEFAYPTAGKPCKTWYKIVGNDLFNSDVSKSPLIAIHGGPESTHHMFTSFTDFTEQYSIPVIFYDQPVLLHIFRRNLAVNLSGQTSFPSLNYTT